MGHYCIALGLSLRCRVGIRQAYVHAGQGVDSGLVSVSMSSCWNVMGKYGTLAHLYKDCVDSGLLLGPVAYTVIARVRLCNDHTRTATVAA